MAGCCPSSTAPTCLSCPRANTAQPVWIVLWMIRTFPIDRVALKLQRKQKSFKLARRDQPQVWTGCRLEKTKTNPGPIGIHWEFSQNGWHFLARFYLWVLSIAWSPLIVTCFLGCFFSGASMTVAHSIWRQLKATISTYLWWCPRRL